MSIKFHEFNTFLTDVIKEEFPQAELYMVHGSDRIQWILMEIRLGEGRLQYKPYDIYLRACEDGGFAPAVEGLLSSVEKML